MPVKVYSTTFVTADVPPVKDSIVVPLGSCGAKYISLESNDSDRAFIIMSSSKNWSSPYVAKIFLVNCCITASLIPGPAIESRNLPDKSKVLIC